VKITYQTKVQNKRVGKKEKDEQEKGKGGTKTRGNFVGGVGEGGNRKMGSGSHEVNKGIKGTNLIPAGIHMSGGESV